MIKKLFKYHIRVYNIYQTFGGRPFAAKELYALDIPGLNISDIEYKGYLETISRKEAEYMRPEIKGWISAPWVFRQLTEEGLQLAEYLDSHPDIIAKKLLL